MSVGRGWGTRRPESGDRKRFHPAATGQDCRHPEAGLPIPAFPFPAGCLRLSARARRHWCSGARLPVSGLRCLVSGLRFPVSGFLALVLLSLSACTKSPPAGGAGPAVLRVSQRNEPADLDPALASLPDEFAVLRALSEGLLVPAAGGADPLPGAAERCEVSADGLTYTFHLRRAARWSNGDAVTAADFVASCRRVLTPATAARKAGVFFPVKNARAFLAGEIADFDAVGIRAADTHTLVVTLGEPNPRFPHYVASGPWLPVHPGTVARHGRQWTRPGNFVGNGPFTLAEWRPHQRLVLRRNPQWHGAAGVRLDEMQFVHFDNGDAEDRAYRAGQIDVTLAIPNSKLETHERERPGEVHRALMLETRYLTFNTTRPPLDNERLRRALALAIDRQKIVDRVTRGRQPVATTLVPPGLLNAPSSDAGHRHDPAGARQLLAAAGLEPGRLRPLELTAWSQSQVPVLEVIQAMWREELGVTATIATRDAKVHLDALASGDYDIGFITAIPDVADAANLLGDFVSRAPENYPHWSDAEFDAGFARLGQSADPAPRNVALALLEARLLRAAAVTPLYFNTKIWLMSPRVRGWMEDGLWTRTYHQVQFAP